MEFEILGSDDGMPGFSRWERKMGYGIKISNMPLRVDYYG